MCEDEETAQLQNSNGKIVYRPPAEEAPHECTPPRDWAYLSSLPIGTEWQCDVDGWRWKLYDQDLVGTPMSPFWVREPAVYRWFRSGGWRIPVVVIFWSAIVGAFVADQLSR